jgi:hypothetical protein
MTTAHVLFTGLPREPDRFERSLRDLAELRSAGIIATIRFSTWTAALDEAPACAELIRQFDVDVIETDDIDDPGQGNLWRQMRSMQTALDASADWRDTDILLKTRTDLWIDPSSVRAILTDKAIRHAPSPLFGAQCFIERMWCPWFEITKPFYLADEVLCGLVSDHRVLTHEDRRYDAMDPGVGRAHIRRFAHPFLHLHDSFEHVMRHGRNDHLIRDERFPCLRARLHDPEYLEALGSYYAMLMSHYCFGIDGAPAVIEFREWSDAGTTIQPNAFDANFEPACSWRQEFGHIYAYDDRWLLKVRAGAVADSHASRAVRSAMRAALDEAVCSPAVSASDTVCG